ncbi:MAG TPA: ABC transporter permease [Kineosporiaceae bacterium]
MTVAQSTASYRRSRSSAVAAGRARPTAGVLRDGLALGGRSLRRLRRSPGKLIGITMNPVVTMITVGYLFAGALVLRGASPYPEYILAGAVVQVGLASLGPTAIGTSTDVQSGIIDRLLTLPISRMGMLVGHTLSDLAAAVAGVVVVVLVGVGLGWRTHADGASTALGFALAVLFIYAMVWVGVAIGLLSKNLETIESVSSLVLVVFSFLSNAFVSVDGLPVWIQPFAAANPVSTVITACRLLWGNPIGTASAVPVPYAVPLGVASALMILVLAVAASRAALRRMVQR